MHEQQPDRHDQKTCGADEDAEISRDLRAVSVRLQLLRDEALQDAFLSDVGACAADASCCQRAG